MRRLAWTLLLATTAALAAPLFVDVSFAPHDAIVTAYGTRPEPPDDDPSDPEKPFEAEVAAFERRAELAQHAPPALEGTKRFIAELEDEVDFVVNRSKFETEAARREALRTLRRDLRNRLIMSKHGSRAVAGEVESLQKDAGALQKRLEKWSSEHPEFDAAPLKKRIDEAFRSAASDIAAETAAAEARTVDEAGQRLLEQIRQALR